jgi:hypothetical protein
MQFTHSQLEPRAPMARFESLFMEHRFGRRFRCGTAVRLSAESGATGDGRLANVSLSGAYVQTAVDLPLFALVAIVAARDERTVERRACVVRKDATGVGVEWCETPTRPICEIFGCTRHCEVL